MKIRLCIFIFILSSAPSVAQSALHKFRKLSRPEKCWVLAHPFRAKKAMRITAEVLAVVDTVKSSGIIGTDIAGGKLDAFKHAYWMASLSCGIGRKQAKKLGMAHEKGNYLQYKKRELEDSILPDSVSCLMDKKNNEAGLSAVRINPVSPLGNIKIMLLKKAEAGYLYTIKKDAKGNYVRCDDSPIDMNEWQGKWNIPKCLITFSKE
ncbi:MAG: hypothetical protein JWO09_3706 [Bacteroidetes bacterium]|nr:hypothetical protein [Bacteroidota bacterium]